MEITESVHIGRTTRDSIPCGRAVASQRERWLGREGHSGARAERETSGLPASARLLRGEFPVEFFGSLRRLDAVDLGKQFAHAAIGLERFRGATDPVMAPHQALVEGFRQF